MTHALKIVGLISALFGTHHLFWVLRFPDQLFPLLTALPGSLLVLVVTLLLPTLLIVAGVGVLLGKSKFPIILGIALTGYLLVSAWSAISQFQFWLSHPEHRGKLSWVSLYGVLQWGGLLLFLFLFYKKAQSNNSFKSAPSGPDAGKAGAP